MFLNFPTTSASATSLIFIVVVVVVVVVVIVGLLLEFPTSLSSSKLNVSASKSLRGSSSRISFQGVGAP